MNHRGRRRWVLGLGIGVLAATGVIVTVNVWPHAADSRPLTALGPAPFTTIREGGSVDVRWRIVAHPAWSGDPTPCVGRVDPIPGLIGAGGNCFVDVGGEHSIEATVWRGDGRAFAVVGAVSAEVTGVDLELIDVGGNRHRVTVPPVEATGVRHRVFAYVHQPAGLGPEQVSTIASVRAIGPGGTVLYQVGPFTT